MLPGLRTVTSPDRHLRRIRALYAARRDALTHALAHAPSIRTSGLAAGFHAVASLPSHADEKPVDSTARRRSVGLHGRGPTASTEPAGPQIVLGFGNLSVGAIQQGIAAIGDLLQ